MKWLKRKPPCTCVLERDMSFGVNLMGFYNWYRVDDGDCPRHGRNPRLLEGALAQVGP